MSAGDFFQGWREDVSSLLLPWAQSLCFKPSAGSSGCAALRELHCLFALCLPSLLAPTKVQTLVCLGELGGNAA